MGGRRLYRLCCLGPLLAVTGIGATLAAFLAPSLAWIAVALGAAGVALAFIVRRGRSRAVLSVGKDAQMDNVTVCRLPVTDRAQRTADFRRLFADTLVNRARVSDGVHWTLRAGDTTEAESHRLAALEARCCDGIRFDVRREDDHVVWRITGPASAGATLDALYELPVLVASDERASDLWAALDAAACGPRSTR